MAPSKPPNRTCRFAIICVRITAGQVIHRRAQFLTHSRSTPGGGGYCLAWSCTTDAPWQAGRPGLQEADGRPSRGRLACRIRRISSRGLAHRAPAWPGADSRPRSAASPVPGPWRADSQRSARAPRSGCRSPGTAYAYSSGCSTRVSRRGPDLAMRLRWSSRASAQRCQCSLRSTARLVCSSASSMSASVVTGSDLGARVLVAAMSSPLNARTRQPYRLTGCGHTSPTSLWARFVGIVKRRRR